MLGTKAFKWKASKTVAESKQPANAATAPDAAKLTDTKKIDVTGGSSSTNNCSIKSRVYNSNLKYMIDVFRNRLELEAMKTNAMMRQKIQEWTTRDYAANAVNMAISDNPLNQENEAMRQLLSDLVNGPLSGLLTHDDRKKLRKISVPALPANGMFMDSGGNLTKALYSYESQTNIHADPNDFSYLSEDNKWEALNETTALTRKKSLMSNKLKSSTDKKFIYRDGPITRGPDAESDTKIVERFRRRKAIEKEREV